MNLIASLSLQDLVCRGVLDSIMTLDLGKVVSARLIRHPCIASTPPFLLDSFVCSIVGLTCGRDAVITTTFSSPNRNNPRDHTISLPISFPVDITQPCSFFPDSALSANRCNHVPDSSPAMGGTATAVSSCCRRQSSISPPRAAWHKPEPVSYSDHRCRSRRLLRVISPPQIRPVLHRRRRRPP